MKCELSSLELSEWVGAAVLAERVPQSHYTYSLRACAIAEAKIAEFGLQGEYVPQLASICFPGDGEDSWFLYCFGLATATARQRCEAMWAIRDKIKAEREAGR